MENNELATRDYQDTPAIADDFLLAVADQAEKRIDAVIKIKQVALKVTNARDWTDQQGNPYLQVSGSEKIANLFNISWRIEEPRCEEEADGHFTYSIKGIFSLGGRTIEVEGTRSSKDGFFNKYIKQADGSKTLAGPAAIDKGDVKKAALTNLFGNGITRMLGIRNLTWEDLQKYAGISQEMIKNKVSYNQREENGDRPELGRPQSKSQAATTTQTTTTDNGDYITAVIDNFIPSPGDKKPWAVIADGKKYTSFSDTLAKVAESLKGHQSKIGYVKKGNFYNLTGIEAADSIIPDRTVIAGCTEDPAGCEHSVIEGTDAKCRADGDKACRFQKEPY